ncbi:hypothetical protein KA012_00495 [Candidatus Woesebacteria bacterium]|nr:hypothetical protein [Candidatus Woesebacteria bacterium]
MARIAILTTPEGHFSIATAMQEVLSDKHEVSFISIRDSSFNLYTPIYQFFPSAYRVPYVISQGSSVASVISKVLKKKLLKQVSAFVESSNPDIIICANWIFLPALESLHSTNHIPIINAITDPWTIHPSLISTKSVSNLVFDKKTLSICQEINPDARYDISGWFVQRSFYQAVDTKRMQKKLKLNEKLKTVVIVGGSEGTMMILKLVPALMQLTKPVNAIVLCGNNKNLLNSVKSFAQILKAVSNQSRIIPVAYTSDVASYLSVADVVIGKAGPNTIFESVAAKKPFIAITHVSGQEDGNLDLIKAYRVGFVEENALKVLKLLQAVLDNPGRIKILQEPLERLAAHNQQADKKLLEIVDSILKKEVKKPK